MIFAMKQLLHFSRNYAVDFGLIPICMPQTAMFGSPELIDEELMGGLFITWFSVTAENSHRIPNPSL